jgi:protein-serine/threonine kinase
VFKMGKSSQKGKERLDDEPTGGISPSTSVGLSPVRPKAFERSLTDPSYFPPVGVHDPPNGNGNGGTSDTQGHVQTNRDLTGLGQLRDMDIRRNDSIVTHTTSSSSGEQARKYSTTGSSHSSNVNGHGNLAGSSSISQSSVNVHGGHGQGQPARSPGSTPGFGGFKSRFFSNPSKTGTRERDASPSRELSASTSTSIAGPDKYKGAGIGGTGREVSIGSSSLSPSDISPEKSFNGRGKSPRTPNRQNLHPPPLPLEDQDGGTQTPTKSSGSAATRWLRRVVSAPNTKALLSPNKSTIPPVPPVPISATQPHTPSSPVIVITSQDHATESPTNDEEPVSPTKRNTPSPHKPPIGSSLNPGGITRGQRAATISSGAKAKDIQAQLGIGGPGVSHHKQVFRRTYSSNSIKTRSVSLFLLVEMIRN